MNVLGRWLRRRGHGLAPAERERLARYEHTPAPDPHVALEEAGLVVVDAETSGLNVRRDSLIALGAVHVDGLRLQGDGFEAVLRQETASGRANILVHQIAPDEQRGARSAASVLLDFLEFIGKRPCVAYHAPFDAAFLNRAARRYLGIRLKNIWIDLARVAPALFPEARLLRAPLDAWLARFGLQALARHRPLDDAYVTGELMLVCLAHARRQGVVTVAQFAELARNDGTLGMGGDGV